MLSQLLRGNKIFPPERLVECGAVYAVADNKGKTIHPSVF